MSPKGKDILSSLNAPWITEDGHLDLEKFPIDSTLKQSLSENERDVHNACIMLESMYSAGRKEAAVFLYGLLLLHRDDMPCKEAVVEALGRVKTKESAELLFSELKATKSSNSTRRYIDRVLKSLRFFPQHLIEDGFAELIKDKKWSYRMKLKFREIIDRSEYDY